MNKEEERSYILDKLIELEERVNDAMSAGQQGIIEADEALQTAIAAQSTADEAMKIASDALDN